MLLLLLIRWMWSYSLYCWLAYIGSEKKIMKKRRRKRRRERKGIKMCSFMVKHPLLLLLLLPSSHPFIIYAHKKELWFLTGILCMNVCSCTCSSEWILYTYLVLLFFSSIYDFIVSISYIFNFIFSAFQGFTKRKISYCS